MNTPVSFELVKLLKEKGFDQKSTENGYKISGEESFDFTLDRINGIGIAAPTIAEVVMWLYEKHGIWIYIKPGVRQKTWDYIVQKEDCDFAIPFFEIKQHKPFFNFPTEAYEAAITYTLTNLI